ncbi:hypothetical protein [Beduini massiliensis]|uniref:hypothetical protein n=1 Tax=Beduini massiliensis TaxID=1585974 RepID=UPI0011CA62B8|nr:hypothetical protein [Beduini massiliensis]
MKIRIKSKGFRLWLYLPYSLFLNRYSFSLLFYALKRYVYISPMGQRDFLKQIKKYRKQFKGLTLVEVHSSDGDDIIIRL